MVVLAVGVQPRGRAKRRIGGGRTGVAESRGGGDQADRRTDGEAELRRKRTVYRGDDGNRAKRGADAHRHEQADRKHQKSAPETAAADQSDDAGNEGVDRLRLAQDVAVSRGDEHDKGDDPHDLKAAHKGAVDILPLERAGDDHNDDGGKRAKRQGTGHKLRGKGHNDGGEGQGVRPGEFFFGQVHIGADDRLILITTRLSVRNMQRDEKAGDHARADYPGVVEDGGLCHLHAVAPHFAGDYSVEYQSETNWQRDVGSLEAKGERAGGGAAVYLQFVEEQKQRRDQNRDKSDMDGNQIL